MTVKVPPLLHKMSMTAQKAWYKKHGMEMPAGAEGKSAAQAKMDVGEINKKKAREAAIAAAAAKPKNKELVSSSERVRKMAALAKAFGGQRPGGDLTTASGIVQHIRSGGTLRAGRLGEENIQEGNPATKEKVKNYVRGLGVKATIKGLVPFDQIHSPLRSGRKVLRTKTTAELKKEEVKQVDEMDKSQRSSSRGAEGLATGNKATPVTAKKNAADALKLLKKKVNPVKEEVEQIEEASPMIKPPTNRFDKKSDAFAHVEKHGGKVYKQTYTDSNGQQTVSYSVKKEEVELDEVTKKEAEAVLGGEVKEKPQMAPGKQPAGYRYVRGLARKAMKKGIKNEFDSPARKAMERELQYNPKYRMEEVELVEQDDTMEKKEMAQTQLHFIGYAAKEILEFIDMGGEIEEWYQNKLSKVQSEVESLHSYIEGEKRRTGMVKEENEEVEQIDELDRKTRVSYLKKSLTQLNNIASSRHTSGNKTYGSKEVGKRLAGLSRLERSGGHSPSVRDNIDKARAQFEEVEQIDEGDLSIRTLYNKWADHYTSSEGNSAKRADAVEKTITKVHGPTVMKHLQKAVNANLRGDFDGEENHFEKARTAAEKSGSDRVGATVGKDRSRFRKEEIEQVTEAEGTVAVTPKEKELAAHHGDKTRITYGDVIKARLKSAAAKKMGK